MVHHLGLPWLVGWLFGGGCCCCVAGVCWQASSGVQLSEIKSSSAHGDTHNPSKIHTPNQPGNIMAIHRISCFLLLSPLVIAWCFCHVHTVRGMYASSAWGLVNVSASAGGQWTNVLFSSDNGAAIAAAAANGSPTLYPWTGWAVPRPGHEHTPCISPIKRYS